MKRLQLNLQLKYTLVNIFFMAMGSVLCGFSTIFLQERGVSNTGIGLVRGASCILLILLSPYITTMVQRVKGLTTRKLFLVLAGILIVIVLLLLQEGMPINVVLVLYLGAMLLQATVLPVLANLAMEYIQNGEKVNFGVSRGIGSLSYAVGAMVAGKAVERMGTQMIMYISLMVLILLVLVLFSMPDAAIIQQQVKKKVSFIGFSRKYLWFLLLLAGFALCYGVAVAQDTYMINIINNLGGDTAFYGFAVFFGAATEMPMMAITPMLRKRYSSRTLLGAAAIAYIFRNVLICMAPNLGIFLVGQVFQGMSFGIFTVVIAYYVAEHLELSDQMLGQTCVNLFTGGIGATMGNVMGGVLQDVWGLDVLFAFLCVVTVLGSATILSQLRAGKGRQKGMA